MRIFFLVLLVYHLLAPVKAVGKPLAIVTKLSEDYLKSFVESANATPNGKQGQVAKPSQTNVSQIHLSPRAQREVVFNKIFAKSSYYQQMDNVLNRYAWHDLNLFCGTTTAPGYHLLSRLNKTVTVLGEVALALFISAPTASLSTLKWRQACIRFLHQNNQIYKDLKNALQNYQPSEKRMLSLWAATDPLYTKEYEKYLRKLFYTNAPDRNKSANILQTKKVLLRDVCNIYGNYLWYPLILPLVISEINFWISNNCQRSQAYKAIYPGFVPVYNVLRLNNLSQKPNQKSEGFASYLLPISSTIHFFIQCYTGYANYKEYAGVLENLALRMADLQTFWITIKKVNALVEANPDLELLYGQKMEPIRTLLAASGAKSSQVGTLLSYLEKLPLRTWSYLWHNAGKLLASYQLFLEHKAIFHDAMYALGALDGLVGMVTLIQDTADMDGNHGYTFTKFLSANSHTKPRLALTEMWNSMLSPITAVGNDLTMDGATKTQNIILTGPNAGGKSTFLTGVAIAVLLSQTFGIAPAQSCEMTPFSKINTYINITDDIAAGKSLFLAEVDRFQYHLKLLKSLEPEAFSFTIFDEPFSGTNPIEGAAAEYSVLNYIANYANTLNIVATHYPIVMLLEEREPKKGFKNYKVYIKSIDKTGKIHYTYKVIPGASNQTIAIDILAEQGYQTAMLEQAKDIIAHPERYNKSFSKVAP